MNSARTSARTTGGPLYLGIDGGGSKCRALLTDAGGRVLGTGVAGPANPFQHYEGAVDSIAEASLAALAEAGLGEEALARAVAGVGLAGVNVPSIRERVCRWGHPFAAMYLTTDIHIACLGAHGGEDGAVIVAGTGSVGHVSVRGRSHTYGAHGFPLGDKGSGAWLGLEGMRAALLSLDGLGPGTELLPDFEDHLDASGLELVARMAGARPGDYGALARRVLACAGRGDAVALEIVMEGAGYLDRLAARLLSHGAECFAMLGGLAPHIAPWLSAGTRASLVPPRGQPDSGAVAYAIAMAATATAGLG